MNYYDTCMFSLSDCWLYLPLHDIVIIFLFLGDNVSYTRLQLRPMFCSCYCAASLGEIAKEWYHCEFHSKNLYQVDWLFCLIFCDPRHSD